MSLEQNLESILDQNRIPVVYKCGTGVIVKLRYRPNNQDWLKGSHRAKPTWDRDKKYWLVPLSWFHDVSTRVIKECGSAYIIQPYNAQQKCAPACWDAHGIDCECSCLGEHHGQGHPNGNWYIKSDTFAFTSENIGYSCRLIRTKPPII